MFSAVFIYKYLNKNESASGVDAVTLFNPWSLRLYSLLNEQLCRMAEKPVLPGTLGSPTGSLKRLPTFQTPRNGIISARAQRIVTCTENIDYVGQYRLY